MKSVVMAGAVIVASTVAEPPAGTVIVGAENETLACTEVSLLVTAVNWFGPDVSAAACDSVYVTALAPLFVNVSVRVTGPPDASPSASLPGATDTALRMVRSMWASPAPCTCTLSRKPDDGAAFQFAGTALFCS